MTFPYVAEWLWLHPVSIYLLTGTRLTTQHGDGKIGVRYRRRTAQISLKNLRHANWVSRWQTSPAPSEGNQTS
jgi:hypothetical protein